MRFDIKSTYHPIACLGDPSLYVNSCVIDVKVMTPGNDEALAARIAVDHIDLIRVEDDGESLYAVCDSDSAGWEAVYAKIFDLSSDTPKLREDFFDCEKDCLWHLVFIHQAVFHPKIRQLQCYILDHVAQTFPCESAVLMWEGDSGLTSEELGSIGFRRIAGEGLLLRPNLIRAKYESVVDDNSADIFEMLEDRYVENAWRNNDRL
jgi:hypothetical protein